MTNPCKLANVTGIGALVCQLEWIGCDLIRTELYVVGNPGDQQSNTFSFFFSFVFRSPHFV